MAMHLKVTVLADQRLVTWALAASWLLLVITLIQAPVANTHRWLSVGGLSAQPSVLARLAIILFMAVHLNRARQEGWPSRRLAVLGGAAAVTAGLVMVEPDLGSTALILLVVAGMAFVAGIPIRLLVTPAVVAVGVLVAAILSSPYARDRVLGFFQPDDAPAASWQTYQSLVALGSGGFGGRGYGAGLQKLLFLPEPHTDFVLSIIGEELGLVGLLAVAILAATITWRGLRIAIHQRQPQRALLAFGLVFAFALQTLVHMAVCLDLLPPKGIPLPLMSYGKTDLLVTITSVGLLLNLSREVAS
jgi:cell division protein FtsW